MGFEKPSWWGKESHQIFTVIVFIVLASLDNSARNVFPPLYAVMAADLNVPEASLGFISALTIMVVALTSLIWGYWGDRSSRKRLLLYGTIIWSLFMALSSVANSYSQLFFYQLMTAVGIGCIASVGFSIVTDLIPPRRRGLLMSFWGLSQAGGGGFGALMGSMLGASNWRLPFAVIAMAGLLFALLYLFSYEPRRGQSEPELKQIFDAGERYGRRIKLADLKFILNIRSNRWLILQVLMGTMAFGSLVWLPRLYIGRLQALGYALDTATVAGNLLAVLFQLGLFGAVIGGYLGDRLERRYAPARAWLGTIGNWGTMPFLMIIFFLPIPFFEIPTDANTLGIVQATVWNLVTNPWILLAFIFSFIAFGLMALDNPNRAALISNMNQPEHRGTIAGLITLTAGFGLAVGNALTGIAQAFLSEQFAPPMNFAIGLALFQLFFIPAGYFFFLATRSTPRDVANARQILKKRGQQTMEERLN
ncbi:MFS transporter [Chloroflexi bacterium TSY]|nr:MFS transporter [Chloroflexi bacterium TSY]